jgi:hypothetical protein
MKWVEARLMVFAIKPLLMPSLKRRFQGELKKIVMHVRLDADTADNLSLIVGTHKTSISCANMSSKCIK